MAEYLILKDTQPFLNLIESEVKIQMLVAKSITFSQNTLDISIEKFIMLTKNSSYGKTIWGNNTEYLIVMKYFIEYLKTHPESKICDRKITRDIIRHLRNSSSNLSEEEENIYQFQEFRNNKMQQFGFQKSSLVLEDIFKVWFSINKAIENLETNTRGNYGRR